MEAGGVLQVDGAKGKEVRCEGKEDVNKKEEWMGNDGVCLFLSTGEPILLI